MYGLSSSEDELTGEGWITWFCNLKGHEFFAEVDDEYIQDNFNLYGLRNRVQYYDHSYEMLLSRDVPDDDDLNDNQYLEIYRDATDLYALIHSRYIISPRGLQAMREKYLHGVFGVCPRALCDRQYVIPVGTSEDLHMGRVNVYCPRCEQMYTPKTKHAENDGVFFGMSFPHIFLQQFPALVPLEPVTPYRARVFGFLIHGQRSLLETDVRDAERNERAKKARAAGIGVGAEGEAAGAQEGRVEGGLYPMSSSEGGAAAGAHQAAAAGVGEDAVEAALLNHASSMDGQHVTTEAVEPELVG